MNEKALLNFSLTTAKSNIFIGANLDQFSIYSSNTVYIFNPYLTIIFRLQCKRLWKLPCRTNDWWQKLLSVNNLEQEWCSNLRINYSTFMVLVNMIKGEVALDPKSFRKDVVSAEKKVATTLYYLKDQGSY